MSALARICQCVSFITKITQTHGHARVNNGHVPAKIVVSKRVKWHLSHTFDEEVPSSKACPSCSLLFFQLHRVWRFEATSSSFRISFNSSFLLPGSSDLKETKGEQRLEAQDSEMPRGKVKMFVLLPAGPWPNNTTWSLKK